MERQWQMLFERSEFICRSGMKQIFSISFKAHVFFCFFSLRQRKERKESKKRKESVSCAKKRRRKITNNLKP